ncbi:hypothetical protein QOZ80_3BG0287650 [Eleusine coracana subsp. coracana]|uniref:BZIP domain-containing protein n=1 Tax=Eleusine coracana subsp. coracana TaxID=191504 RepID=A0AAV9FVT2_ELECO|nr:hypothetical protein QOZ80_UnG0725990 [Eleusine coracana subsp. coracana]KAK3147858.1 hypothetical protein QOZ80_3BG0287650 [Eleusine coracana subsp. coracana]
MGKGDVTTRSKSQKPSAVQSEQNTPTNPPMAYPDWSQFQAYYNAAGTAPMTPPAFFHSPVTPNPQGHPYMWGPQMMPPYGTPPYAAMYAQGTPYQQTPMPPGSHPYSPYPVQSPNGTVQIPPKSGAGGTETDKSSKNKRKTPLKRSKGSLGSLDVVMAKNNKSPAKPSASSSNEGSSQSESGSGSSSEGSSTNSKSGSRVKDGTEHGQSNDAANKGAQGSVVEPTQPSGPVVLNPMMPFWPVPPPMAGPATTVNMGGDYWGAPTSVPMHSKIIAAPTSAPSSNSRDVLSDPAIQDERELKKQKRKQSNRESARRSRLRKQAEWEEVANRADLLKQENSSLKEELKQLQEKCDSLTSENTSLHEKLKELEDEKSNGNWYKD